MLFFSYPVPSVTCFHKVGMVCNYLFTCGVIGFKSFLLLGIELPECEDFSSFSSPLNFQFLAGSEHYMKEIMDGWNGWMDE